MVIAILIAAGAVLAAVVGWVVNDLTSGRRLRRRVRREHDTLTQKLTADFASAVDPPLVDPPVSVLGGQLGTFAGIPVITSDAVPPDQVAIMSLDWLTRFDQNPEKPQRKGE